MTNIKDPGILMNALDYAFSAFQELIVFIVLDSVYLKL